MKDETIIGLFFDRSQDALTLLDRKYGRLLRHVTGNVLRDPRDAEEAVSDAYMKLWDSIPPERPANLMAYAVRLSRNAAVDVLRRSRCQKRRHEADVLLSELDECLPGGAEVEEYLEAQELAEQINDYLRTLDADSRSLFIRRYFSMDELEELASDFGLTKNAVSARLYRTRRGLQQHLRKEGIAL